MVEGRPSRTAALVAAARAMGPLLPGGKGLIDDPFAERFADPRTRAIGRALSRLPLLGPRLGRATGMAQLLCWVQVRSRAIDDALIEFQRAGGAQVVLLGAGFDCRAWRMRELDGATFFEVDHPATQGKKRAVLASAGAPLERARFLEWNFERRAMAELPDALAAIGLDRARPVATVWEGVTTYLTPEAIDASLAAVHAYSAPGSRLAFTYLHVRELESPSLGRRIANAWLGRIGEPFRFGIDPAELARFLEQRGFRLVSDRSGGELVRQWLPELARRYRGGGSVAVAER